MQAVVGIFRMDRALFTEQQRVLQERIVPFAKAQPGFVAGYWAYDHANAKSYSFILLDSEPAAREFADTVARLNAPPGSMGVELESIVPVEIIAEAGK